MENITERCWSYLSKEAGFQAFQKACETYKQELQVNLKMEDACSYRQTQLVMVNKRAMKREFRILIERLEGQQLYTPPLSTKLSAQVRETILSSMNLAKDLDDYHSKLIQTSKNVDVIDLPQDPSNVTNLGRIYYNWLVEFEPVKAFALMDLAAVDKFLEEVESQEARFVKQIVQLTIQHTDHETRIKDLMETNKHLLDFHDNTLARKGELEGKLATQNLDHHRKMCAKTRLLNARDRRINECMNEIKLLKQKGNKAQQRITSYQERIKFLEGGSGEKQTHQREEKLISVTKALKASEEMVKTQSLLVKDLKEAMKKQEDVDKALRAIMTAQGEQINYLKNYALKCHEVLGENIEVPNTTEEPWIQICSHESDTTTKGIC